MNPDELVSDLLNKDKKIEEVGKVAQELKGLFIGLIVVIGLGLIAVIIAVMSPIIDTWRFKAETYQNLVNKVSEQNTKIEVMNEVLRNLQPRTQQINLKLSQ